MGDDVRVRVRSAATVGIEAREVQVEIGLTDGPDRTVIVGLPDRGAREVRDRVRAALNTGGWPYPAGRLTVDLTSAGIRKHGATYDLPIAIGILAASGQVGAERLAESWLVGELAMDGRLRSVRGVLPMAEACRRHGVRHLVVPEANAREARLVPDLEVVPAANLEEAVSYLAGGVIPLHVAPAPYPTTEVPDFSDVIGLAGAKRALQVAAAGGHHLLMSGPPGVGKTMLACRLPGIMGPLDEEAALEVTRIYSVAGLLREGGPVRVPPFRAPHHTVSHQGLVGGGLPLQPGEISLSHRGVLFLDEAPEFARPTLDALRQPLDEGQVHLVRVGGRTMFPANFLLVLAMNPCPCGYRIAASARCRCPESEVERYQRRLSGPLMDRIDLRVELDGKVPGGPSEVEEAGSTAALWAGVERARRVQRERGQRRPNARCSMGTVEGWNFAPGARRDTIGCSPVWVDRVSRTLADLEGSDRITVAHSEEALALGGRQ